MYSRDLYEPAPTSLQVGTPAGEARTIPVYPSDGHTVIGDLLVGGGAITAPASAAPSSAGP